MASEASSTPRLSLFSLPIKPAEPPGMLTPPLHTSASVPFQWEEAPGKPRAYTTTSTERNSKPDHMCLDLPPRLLKESKVTNLSSPTTVLDGPYVGRTLSFSFGKGSFGGHESVERSTFSSRRWESYKENSGVLEGNFGFSFDVGGGFENDTKVKTKKFKSRSSFTSFSQTRSNMWTGIYQSFKQAIPWGRRQGK